MIGLGSDKNKGKNLLIFKLMFPIQRCILAACWLTGVFVQLVAIAFPAMPQTSANKTLPLSRYLQDVGYCPNESVYCFAQCQN